MGRLTEGREQEIRDMVAPDLLPNFGDNTDIILELLAEIEALRKERDELEYLRREFLER